MAGHLKSEKIYAKIKKSNNPFKVVADYLAKNYESVEKPTKKAKIVQKKED
jgi:Lhr-like helicase